MNILCPSMIVFPLFLLSAAVTIFVYGPARYLHYLRKKYNIANTSSHFGSYGSSLGPYTIFFVTDRSIDCNVTLSAMNYLLLTILKK